MWNYTQFWKLISVKGVGRFYDVIKSARGEVPPHAFSEGQEPQMQYWR